MDSFEHTILIIDDDTLNITALTHLLSDEFNVYVEQSGARGIKMAKEIQPHIILLDVVMPDMNGFEVLAALKKEDTTKDIPVIFVTGLNNTRDEEQGLILGAVDYINKPFSAYIVKLRIRNQLQIYGQLQEIHESSTMNITDIGNKNTFRAAIAVEWENAIKSQSSLSVALLNVDNLKKYNEKYGHQQGDETLKTLSHIIVQSTYNKTTQSVKWNGDEFALLLGKTEESNGRKVVENIIETIQNDSTLSEITISIGLHSCMPSLSDNYSMDNFISDVNTALMSAKAIDTNKVCIFQDLRGVG